MAVVDMVMPQMGESVMEGTILKWCVKLGDTIEEDDSIAEVATDKVDTDIPSAFSGKVVEILIPEGEIAQVGSPICKIETEAAVVEKAVETPTPTTNTEPELKEATSSFSSGKAIVAEANSPLLLEKPVTGRFYSPLVLNIARKENISMDVLERIVGSGKEGRVTKKDILAYVNAPKSNNASASEPYPNPKAEQKSEVDIEAKIESKAEVKTEVNPEVKKEDTPAYVPKTSAPSISGETEIIEMDRMRQIIAERMLESKRTSAHVTSFVEADVTNIVYWKNRNKTKYKEKENTILTLTPIFMEAVVKALKDYPKMNASVVGTQIHIKKDINLGLAVALPSGNLIVPVVKHADQLNLVGLTKQVNDLAKRARHNQLKPADLEGGTFTISNMGSFGNIMGTPILVQPQIGILALGAVVKKPTVIETPHGDTIGIRHKMILSHSYDHRVVDGALGGMFVRRVADYLERFDTDREL